MSLPWGRRASRSVKEPNGEQMLPSSQFRLKLTLTRVDLHVGALYFIQSNLIWNLTHPCWKSNPSFLKFSWRGQLMAWHGNNHLDFLFLKTPSGRIFYMITYYRGLILIYMSRSLWHPSFCHVWPHIDLTRNCHGPWTRAWSASLFCHVRRSLCLLEFPFHKVSVFSRDGLAGVRIIDHG